VVYFQHTFTAGYSMLQTSYLLNFASAVRTYTAFCSPTKK